MRKAILPRQDAPSTSTSASTSSPASGPWIDLDRHASVEVTSEDPEHPVEAALVVDGGAGWRADAPGEQTLRIRFDVPRPLRRILLSFVETEVERTQELAISWSPDGSSYREVVRQRWNFSPRGATREDEDYRVELEAVRVIELTIRPDVSGGDAVASLEKLRMA